LFISLLIPASLLAWFLGVLHFKVKAYAKFLFLLLLALPVFIEQEALIIFITAFFMLGYLYTEEKTFSVLFSRIQSAIFPSSSKRTKKKDYEYEAEQGEESEDPEVRSSEKDRQPDFSSDRDRYR